MQQKVLDGELEITEREKGERDEKEKVKAALTSVTFEVFTEPQSSPLHTSLSTSTAKRIYRLQDQFTSWDTQSSFCQTKQFWPTFVVAGKAYQELTKIVEPKKIFAIVESRQNLPEIKKTLTDKENNLSITA